MLSIPIRDKPESPKQTIRSSDECSINTWIKPADTADVSALVMMQRSDISRLDDLSVISPVHLIPAYRVAFASGFIDFFCLNIANFPAIFFF
jgi:hypothetical protein